MNWLERKAVEVALQRFLKGAYMQAITSWLSGRKTYITGVVSILIAAASLAGIAIPGVPALDHSAATQTIVTALMGIFIRNGVAKNGKQ